LAKILGNSYEISINYYIITFIPPCQEVAKFADFKTDWRFAFKINIYMHVWSCH